MVNPALTPLFELSQVCIELSWPRTEISCT